MDPLTPEALHEIRNLQQQRLAGVADAWFDDAVARIRRSGAIRPASIEPVPVDVLATAIGARLRGDAATVAVDRDAILQVAVNLVRNAGLHGGGMTTCRLHLRDMPGGQYLVVQVGDRGGTSTTPGSGYGLGVCQALTANHGGWFQPRSATHPVARAVFRVDGAVRAPVPCSVLCVEDYPINQHLLTHMIRRAGAETVIAATVAAATAALRGRHYPIAFVDRHLPDGDGLALAHTLAAQVGRVLIMSGDEPDPTWPGTWLVKPLTESDMVAAMWADMHERTVYGDVETGAANRLFAGGDTSAREYRDAARLLQHAHHPSQQRELAVLCRRLGDGEAIRRADIETALHWQVFGPRGE